MQKKLVVVISSILFVVGLRADPPPPTIAVFEGDPSSGIVTGSDIQMHSVLPGTNNVILIKDTGRLAFGTSQMYMTGDGFSFSLTYPQNPSPPPVFNNMNAQFVGGMNTVAISNAITAAVAAGGNGGGTVGDMSAYLHRGGVDHGEASGENRMTGVLIHSGLQTFSMFADATTRPATAIDLQMRPQDLSDGTYPTGDFSSLFGTRLSQASATGSSVLSSDSSSSFAPWSVVVGGFTNRVMSAAEYSGVFAGQRNTVDGIRSVVIGGATNVVNASDSVVVSSRSVTLSSSADRAFVSSSSGGSIGAVKSAVFGVSPGSNIQGSEVFVFGGQPSVSSGAHSVFSVGSGARSIPAGTNIFLFGHGQQATANTGPHIFSFGRNATVGGRSFFSVTPSIPDNASPPVSLAGTDAIYLSTRTNPDQPPLNNEILFDSQKISTRGVLNSLGTFIAHNGVVISNGFTAVADSGGSSFVSASLDTSGITFTNDQTGAALSIGSAVDVFGTFRVNGEQILTAATTPVVDGETLEEGLFLSDLVWYDDWRQRFLMEEEPDFTDIEDAYITYGFLEAYSQWLSEGEIDRPMQVGGDTNIAHMIFTTTSIVFNVDCCDGVFIKRDETNMVFNADEFQFGGRSRFNGSIRADDGDVSMLITNNSFSVTNNVAGHSVTVGPDGVAVFGSFTVNNIFVVPVADTAPASNDDGVPGQIKFHDGNLYICVDTDDWRRVDLSTF